MCWPLYLEFLRPYFPSRREKNESLFSRERIVGGEWIQIWDSMPTVELEPARGLKVWSQAAKCDYREMLV